MTASSFVMLFSSPVLLRSCRPEAGIFCPPKDLGEPRNASRSLRRNKCAFGSHPHILPSRKLALDCRNLRRRLPIVSLFSVLGEIQALHFFLFRNS